MLTQTTKESNDATMPRVSSSGRFVSRVLAQVGSVYVGTFAVCVGDRTQSQMRGRVRRKAMRIATFMRRLKEHSQYSLSMGRCSAG